MLFGLRCRLARIPRRHSLRRRVTVQGAGVAARHGVSSGSTRPPGPSLLTMPTLEPLTDERRALAERHVWFAEFIVARFYGYLQGADREDAVASALYGIVVAATRYVDRGHRFRTYAGFCCHNSIREDLR